MLLLLGSGCLGDDEAAATDEFLVVASTSVVADLASLVVADHAEVVSLVPVGGDPHVHEPTPGDARTLERADLVLHNGAGLEPWLDPLLQAANVVEADLASSVPDARVAMRDGRPDPHLWMAPPYAAAYIEVIADRVAALRPEAALQILEAAEEAGEQIEALDEELRLELESIPLQHRKLVTSHDAYGYFGAHYGFEIVGSVVGLSTEEEPSPAALARLVDAIEREGVPTIFVESTINPDLIESVAREAGVDVGQPLYGDSLGPPGSGADTYAGMMRQNVAALVEGLGE